MPSTKSQPRPWWRLGPEAAYGALLTGSAIRHKRLQAARPASRPAAGPIDTAVRKEAIDRFLEKGGQC